MPKIQYADINFNATELDIIGKAIKIIQSYKQQGFNLTLRQAYYQFVSRDWFPAKWADKQTGSTNNLMSYKKLGTYISDARLAGLIDWNDIIDRTRELGVNSHWDTPADIIDGVARSYRIDKWQTQDCRVEIWVEKDALEGIIEKVGRSLDVNYFSCRGYTSQTSIWEAGQRLKNYAEGGQKPIIVHLGDHDPSGIDMTRDVEERLRLFMGRGYGRQLKVERIALNFDQVQQYTPPPNPTKVTDSRAKKYIEEFGEECWELDALEPTVIEALITEKVLEFRDEPRFAELESR